MARFQFVTNNLPEAVIINIDMAKNIQIDLMKGLADIGALNSDTNSKNNAKIIAPSDIPNNHKATLKNMAYSFGCKVEYSNDLDWDIEGGAGTRLNSEERMASLKITDDIAKAQYLEAVKYFEEGKKILRELIKEGKMIKVPVGSYIGNDEENKKKRNN